MKGRKAGNKSIMNRGTEINNQATAPQSVSPRDAKTINFFFVDSSMSFIHYLSANDVLPGTCYMRLERGGISTDAKEIKRVLQERVRQHSC